MSDGASLRARAAQLKADAEALERAADILDGVVGRSKTGSTSDSSGIGKKEQIKEFLKKNGPSTRGQIEKQGGFRIGTLSFILKESNGFLRSEDGKWSVKE